MDTDADQQLIGTRDEAAPARWTARAGALAMDVMPGAAVLATTVLGALSVPLHTRWWWMYVAIGVVAILWTAFNRVLLPVVCGQSLGRAVWRITIVRRDGDTVGPWRLLLRDVTHLMDTASLCLGWLWPLWDQRRRTFADILLRTEARILGIRRANHSPRRPAAAVMLTAAVLCTAAALISDAVVRQRDRVMENVKTQVAALGPRMIGQMLSYHPETIKDDFDHALSLASDNYRGQLSALQQAARKAGLVRNEYWPTESAVLTATPDRATMLVFLQGERGVSPNRRYLAASVRATFVKSGRAGWRVDDIAVVAEPQVGGAKP